MANSRAVARIGGTESLELVFVGVLSGDHAAGGAASACREAGEGLRIASSGWCAFRDCWCAWSNIDVNLPGCRCEARKRSQQEEADELSSTDAGLCSDRLPPAGHERQRES